MKIAYFFQRLTIALFFYNKWKCVILHIQNNEIISIVEEIIYVSININVFIMSLWINDNQI